MKTEDTTIIDQDPLVSVVINCRNSDEFLAEAIDSVYNQEFQDWEIIFFDNASSDLSASIAKSYDARLRYFYSDQALSLGAARNAAIRHVRGRYISFLDCDDLWDASKLEAQISLFQSSNRTGRILGMSYTNSDRISSTGELLLSYAYEKRGTSGNIYKDLIGGCFIACSSVILATEALKVVGGFNQKWNQVEDWDLWIRVAKRYDIIGVDRSLTKIRIHDGNLSRDIFSHFSEKIQLLQEIQSSDNRVSSLCRQAINVMILQRHVAEFLLKNRAQQRFHSALLILGWAILHPILFVRTALKYLNPKMYSLFKLKFSQA